MQVWLPVWRGREAMSQGISSLSPELNTKRLEVLKDAVPKLARVGLLRLPGNSIGKTSNSKSSGPRLWH